MEHKPRSRKKALDELIDKATSGWYDDYADREKGQRQQ
jgi:hypothetical protein